MTETTWTPTTITLSKLKPWERNPKRISKAHAARLLDLWERLGQFQTIAIGPAGEVYDGHQRLSVLKAKHGGGYVVQVLQASRPLTEAEREELTIAAHSGTTGSWDWDALANWDVDNLTAWGLDEELLKDWNAGATALREMLAAETAATGEDPGPQVDKAAELQAKWGTATGQLWQLGEHRLICGDCTDPATVRRVMGGERAQLCFTDPPYGADIEYAGYKDTQGALVALIDGFFPLAQQYSDLIALTPGINNVFLYEKPDWILCWFYGVGTGRSPWGFTAWQPILVFGKDPKLANGEGCHPDGFQFQMTQEDMEINRGLGHVVPKPLSVWVRFMERLSTKKTVIVYEPFGGSGTTLIACERLGRKCRAVEIEPKYVAVALERWATMTGKTPTLLDGAP